MIFERKAVIARVALSLALSVAAFCVRAEPAIDLTDLYRDGTPILDVRYRFERVDQDGFDNNAKANTVRTRAGFETGKVAGIGFGFDVEWTEAIGPEDFDSTTNSRSEYPIVADPDDFALNRLFLVSDGTIPDTVAKLGRQRIIWDDARFIGNVGFRQNEQTFDALRVTTEALGPVALEYAYLDEVHRVFGTDSPVGELGMSSHAVRARITGLGSATVVPFALLLDYDRTDEAANSSASYGVRVTGDHALSADWTLLYAGALAYQKDYEDNPNDMSLWYYAIEPGVRHDGTTFRLGYEVLDGDGTIGFRTPLATLHKFNGLTDIFLVTPADGLQDIYAKLAVDLAKDGWAGEWAEGIRIRAAWHEFFSEQGGGHYGREWNIGAFRTFPTGAGGLTLGLQYADYDADRFATDTGKLWLTVQFKLSPKPFRKAMRGKGR